MASEFLKRMAAQSRARVDQEYSASSYGGSGYSFQVPERKASPLEQLASDIAVSQTARVQDAETAARRARARRNYAAAQQRRAPVSGQLPGTSSGAAPLTAASFGGVTGYRNITPVRQEQPGGLRRIAQGADAAVSGLLGGIGSAVETGKAALGGQADFFSDVGLKGYLTTPMNQLGETRQSPKYRRQMDMDSAAARLMERSAEKMRETVEGLGPKSAWAAENLISVGQNAPAMAAALIPVVGPAISGGMMAASAGGSRAYELQQQGVDAGDAFWRGAVSGGIELATEKLSIDNFLQIAKGTGAKTAVKNLLRQMGVEASEESASYALNFIADKAARDPHAEFSLAELANSAAGGAFSGGIYGGVGLAVNRLGANGQKNYQYLKERDGGKTPDFDAQHTHYYNAARSGMAVDKIPAYPSETPLGRTARQAAAFAGQNDGLSEAHETVRNLVGGKAVSDLALDRALSFPETRKAIAEQAGPLPETSSQARKAVRDWAAARKQEQAAQPVKQPSQQHAPSAKRFRGIAEDVLSTYESRADTAEISDDLRGLYEDLNTPGEAALAANLRSKATGIARKILQQGVPETDELSGQYADLRKYLRSTPVTLSSTDRASVPDGYETFRKRNMGRLRLVNEGGTPVDTMYQQLQADYGEALFPVNITHPADQLEQIGRVLENIRPKAGAAYATESAVHDLALDLIGRCAALPHKPQVAESNAQKQAGTVTAADGIAGEQRAPGLAETEVSRKLKAEDREFLDTLFQAVGLRGAIVSQTSDTANAQIENGVVTVYANADDAASAYRGTVRHEVTHQIKALGAEHYQAFEDFAVAARAARDGVSVESLVESTRETYRTIAGQELTEAQAREELAGDFAMLLDVDTDTVRRFVNQGEQNRQTAKGILQTIRDIISRIRERFANRKLSQEQRTFLQQMQEGERLWAEALGEASWIANKNTVQTDGSARYSIKRAADGSQYVEVDTDIFAGRDDINFENPTNNDLKKIKKVLFGIVEQQFSTPVDAHGQLIGINKKTAREWSRSESADTLRIKHPQWYEDKAGAFAHADEILRASSDYIGEKKHHSRKDNFVEFGKGTVRVKVKGRTYTARVVVGITKTGRANLYDLVSFRPTTIEEAPINTTLAARNAADRRHGTSSEHSITDSGTEVNENLPKRFSLKKPVEETRSLIALHNLTEEKLLKSLKLGGLPMPSIAVTKAGIPHTDFGNITLVMDKKSIDPKASRKNTVYSADAWTPTFPATEYEANPQAEKRVYGRIMALSSRVDAQFRGELYQSCSSLGDLMNRLGGEEGVIQYALDNYGLKAAFLAEQGRPIAAETRQAINAALDHPSYERWVRELYAGLEKSSGVYNNKSRFTDSGKLRSFKQTHYPATLDGIVKAMAGQGGLNNKNVSGFYGVKSLRAGMAQRFRSIADMHSIEGRLKNLTEEESNAITGALEKRMNAIMDQLAEKAPGGLRNDFIQTDSIGNILMEIADSGQYTVDSIVKTFDGQYGYHIGNGLAVEVRNLLFDISQMPVNMFEAKPERAVGFDEVLAAVVPADSGGQLLQALEEAGIQVITYEDGSEQARLDALNSLEDARFSLKNADEAITRLAKYREQYGTLPRGEMAVRDILFPQQTDEYTRVRRFSRTAAESASLTDEQADAIGAAVAEGRFNYEPVGDRAARNYAETMLGRGADAAAEAWTRVVNRDGRASKNDIALGEYLLREAAKQGDTERVVQLTAEIAAEGTRAGQVVQAMRLLKQLDGAGQLVSLDAMLKKLQGDLDKGKSGVFLQVPDELRQELAGAKGETEVNAALDKIYTELARQMPSTWADRWNAWRYLSMLGNPRTHIRNILGNAAFEPAILVKNTIGAALERVFVPQGERTKSLSGLLPGTGGKARKFAQADFKEMKDIITGGGKMNPTDIIRERQRIFRNNTLEWIRKQNFNFLEAEDGIFLEHHYVRAMTQYLKANKVDMDTFDPNSKEGTRLLNRARDYAVREAQKATYRDFSSVAQVISKASRDAPQPFRAIIEGVLPFKKTPVNVLKRGVEYSPIGLANAVTRGTARVVSGKISASEFIDGLSAGLTGTGIAALGWLLASCGILSGGGDDDKEQEFRDALGAQSWALRFGDKTYTIDWLAPSSMPLFVGAETLRLYENGMELNGRSIYDAAMTIAEPMTQMSMLDSLNSMLSRIRHGDNPLSDFLLGAVVDYVSQAVPTLLGQIARTVDPVRHTTYDDKNSGVPSLVQTAAQKNLNKLPGLSQYSASYLDIWGREQKTEGAAARAFQNFISPGYLKNERLSAMESELIRLYQATGESVLPGRAAKSFQVNKETVYLTEKEYRATAQARGAMMYSGLSEITAGSYYNSLEDVDKADVVSNMIQLSNAIAKAGVSDYELKGWYQKAVEGNERYNIPLPAYVLAYSAQANTEGIKAVVKGKKDEDGNPVLETIDNSPGLRKMQAIYQIPGLNDKQRAYLFEACGVGKSVRHYNKAKVEQELKKMEQQAAK